jgi:hypothetical protein
LRRGGALVLAAVLVGALPGAASAERRDRVEIAIVPAPDKQPVVQGGRITVTVSGRARGQRVLHVLRTPKPSDRRCRGGAAGLNAFRDPVASGMRVSGAFRERRRNEDIPPTDFPVGTWWVCAVLSDSLTDRRVAIDSIRVPVVAPSASAAGARPTCKPGYKVQRKRGVLKCVRKPKEPKLPKDAVTPSAITLVAGSLRDERFGATGYMEFAQSVTGTVYGHWVISNGVVRDRARFRLPNLADVTSVNFGATDVKVPMSGRTLTAVLVVGTVRSNRFTLAQ